MPVVPNAGDPNQRRCYGVCLEEHERSHIDDVNRANPGICRGKPRGTQIMPSTSIQLTDSEVRAFEVTVQCLRRRLDEDARDGGCCEAYILDAWNYYQDILEQYRFEQSRNRRRRR